MDRTMYRTIIREAGRHQSAQTQRTDPEHVVWLFSQNSPPIHITIVLSFSASLIHSLTLTLTPLLKLDTDCKRKPVLVGQAVIQDEGRQG